MSAGLASARVRIPVRGAIRRPPAGSGITPRALRTGAGKPAPRRAESPLITQPLFLCRLAALLVPEVPVFRSTILESSAVFETPISGTAVFNTAWRGVVPGGRMPAAAPLAISQGPGQTHGKDGCGQSRNARSSRIGYAGHRHCSHGIQPKVYVPLVAAVIGVIGRKCFQLVQELRVVRQRLQILHNCGLPCRGGHLIPVGQPQICSSPQEKQSR